jgi:hypothetical protein
MTVSKKDLWAAQLEFWPNSVRLDIHEVYQWCAAGQDKDAKLCRWAQAALAMQYPNVVWYRIEGTPYRGFRFGVRGHQYASLYTAGE